MLSIKFYIPDEEDVHEYSLGHMDISIGDQLLSSSGKSQRLMMVFISFVDLSNGIVGVVSDKARKNHEFIGTGSSFRLLINRNDDEISIKNAEQQITLSATIGEVAKALSQCWQDIEKLAINLDRESSAYLHMVSGKESFQKAFADIL